jgi:structural maintenance of chromosome 2
VLGFSSLKLLRVASLRQLIYKEGQAGISRASVSVRFRVDPSGPHRPIGYETCTQLTVCRQILPTPSGEVTTRYLVNGRAARVQAVQRLFASVHLNAKAPHFLVLQGHMSRALSARPAELLHMLEEAASTARVAEEGAAAARHVAKKDPVLAEATTVVDRDIKPKVALLRHQLDALVAFETAERRARALERRCVAHDYLQATTAQAHATARKDAAIASLSSAETEVADMMDFLHALDAKIAAERAAGAADIAALSDAEKARDEAQQALADASGAASALAEELQRAEQAVLMTRNAVVSSQVESEAAASALQADNTSELESRLTAARRRLSDAIGLLSAVSSGVSGDGLTAAGQLAAAADEAAQATAAHAAATTALTAAETRFEAAGRAREALLARDPTGRPVGAGALLEAEVDGVRDRLARAQATLADFDAAFATSASATDLDSSLAVTPAVLTDSTTSASLLRGLRQRRDALNAEIRPAEARLREAASQLGVAPLGTDLESLSLPEAILGGVHGVVARLISVDDAANATAIEVVAGGRLLHVAVDKEATSRAIARSGQLRRRVTFLPVANLNVRRPGDSALRHVAQFREQAGAGAARVAIELISYDAHLQTVMQHIFGSTVVCATADAARAVAFGPAQLRAVTLDGDIFDPAGSLTGGSRPDCRSSLLGRLAAWREAAEAVRAARSKATQASTALTAAEETLFHRGQLSAAVTAATSMLAHAERRMANSVYGRALRTLAQASADLDLARSAAAAAHTAAAAAQERSATLDAQFAGAEGESGTDRLNRLTAERAAAADVVALLERDLAARRSHGEIARSTSLAAAASHAAAAASLQDAERAAADASAALAAAMRYKAEVAVLVSEAETRHSAAASRANVGVRKVEALQDERRAGRVLLGDLESRVAAATAEKDTCLKDLQAAAVTIRRLEQSFEWVTAVKAQFGMKGSEFDLTGFNSQQAARDLAEIRRALHDGPPVDAAERPRLLRALRRCEAAQAGAAAVHTEKEQLLHACSTVDQVKRDTVLRTYLAVNRDLGPIFSQLLRGAYACIEPSGRKPGAQPVAELSDADADLVLSQGFRFRVRFGEGWLKSLSGLSGGQRSLLALAFVLALLKHTPAPVYILDEIDAALDLSHTASIGAVLRSDPAYADAQFVVVSLKEGLFASAPVLFTAQVREGVSEVTRTAQPQFLD